MKYIDLRSDTVTEPTEEMRKAMANAVVGDDVYEDDPTMKKLEELAASTLGKDDALFVPSGTFGNQLSLLTHTSRGNEVLIPADNHIVMHEVGASAVIAGVQLRFVNSSNGSIDTKSLESLIREDDIHYPETGLICMENAHSSGAVVSLENMKEVYEIAKKHGIPVHLDGARIFNAAVSLGVEAKEIAKYTDSVMFCLSKGLCSPIGSMLVGSKEFIKKAKKNRKLMGGGLRQAGILAAAGIISIEKMTKRLHEDHENASYLEKRLEEIKDIKIFKDRRDINMVFFKIDRKNLNEEKFINYLYKNKIKVNPTENGEWRFVTHYWIKKEDIDYTVERIKEFLNDK
jgi:threonine aldolase